MTAGRPGSAVPGGDLVYLYGVVPGGTSLPDGGLLGMMDRPVELVRVGGVQAVATRVPAAAYGPEALGTRLRDLEWAGRQGLAHEEVVSWFVDYAEILPARLFTLYSSLEALRSALAAEAGALEDRLERFRGLREWDLKVSVDEERLTQSLARFSEEFAALDAEIEAAAPGRRYLLVRRRAERARDELAEIARRVARGVLGAAAALAREATTLVPPAGAREGAVALHAAVLIRQEDADALRVLLDERARNLRGAGVLVDHSGPWAPYRFIGIEASAGP